MIMHNLKGKRLLLVGGLNNTVDLFELAHRNHVTVGVADYNHGTLAKGLADYAFDVNAYDEDAMAKLIADERFDGVITAFNERLGPIVRKLADRVGLPAPFTVEQLKMSTNKKFFKHTCQRYGVPVPKEYVIESAADIRAQAIDYPVIIKPVDCASSVGVTPCFDAEALERGYVKAVKASKSGEVIVEQYLPYDEINLYRPDSGKVQRRHHRYAAGYRRYKRLDVHPGGCARRTALLLRGGYAPERLQDLPDPRGGERLQHL